MKNIVDLYQYAERQGIDVDWFTMERAESLSLPLPNGEYGIALDPWKMRTLEDERCKLAHELGHCETGSFYNRNATHDVRQKHENRADKWAVQQLISAAELDEAVADGYTEIWSLAEHFGVTEDFMRKAVCWYVYGTLDVEHYMKL